MKFKIRTNLTGGILSIAFSAFLFFLIPNQIPVESVVNFGITSRSVPYGIAVLIGVCGLILVIQSLVLKKEHYQEIVLKQELRPLLFCVCIVIYLFVMEVDWPISTAALGCAILGISKCKKWYHYLITVVLAFVIYYIFAYTLHIRLQSVIF